MWARGIAGVLLLLVGAVWIAQGVGVAHGSSMTGQSQWAFIGAVAVAVGLALLLAARHVRNQGPDGEE
jgi:hypothetical protein